MAVRIGGIRGARAIECLQGLSVGDALGDQWFREATGHDLGAVHRVVPPGPWHWTDDTNMALSVVEVLLQHGKVDQEALAISFANRYDYGRGYGPSMHRVLRRVADGDHWAVVTKEQFGGQGSYGNGAAMRVAPLGAWFADDLCLVVEEAAKSAQVTHGNREAEAGAVAVAVATALAWQGRDEPPAPPRSFLESVRSLVPDSEVADRLGRAARLGEKSSVPLAVSALGNGTDLSAQDTVPFALWSAATHLDSFEETFWSTVSGLGDRDTTCAIACGVVAGRSGVAGIPSDWLARRESLPTWACP
jgi:ADP-ribosylglycohydrolase